MNAQPRKKSNNTRSECWDYTLLWCVPGMLKAWKNRLDILYDTPQLPIGLQHDTLIKKSEKYIKSAGKDFRVLNLIIMVAKKELYIGFSISVIQGLLTAVVKPLLLRSLIQNLNNPQVETSYLLMLAILLGISSLLEGATSLVVKHALSDRLGAIFVSSITSLVQAKSLRVSPACTTIQVSSLIGVDVLRNYENLRFACLLPTSISALIGGLVILGVTIGIASCVGVAIMVVILIVNARMSLIAKDMEEKDLQAADKRLDILRQILDGIKAIKFCAWEENFMSVMDAARKEEMRWLLKYRSYQQGGVQLGRATPYICASGSFIYLVLTQPVVNPADLFAALNVFLSLRLALIIIPECLTYAGAASVSFKRLEEYLTLDEVEKIENFKQITNPPMMAAHIFGTFTYPGLMKSKELTISQELRIPHGSKVAIVGQVGSGKSTLISCLLGELNPVDPKNSKVVLNCELISFSNQAPFVMSGTVEDNICFDSEKVNLEKFQQALASADFQQDISRFPRGAKEEIGESGITLSGGQKTRVSVARSVYHLLSSSSTTTTTSSSSSLLLLDDILAAVDHRVAMNIFTALLDLVKTRNITLVMALNQLQHLPDFDLIIVMEQNTVVEVGSYKELLGNEKGSLRRLLEREQPELTTLTEEVPDVSTIQEDDLIRSRRLSSFSNRAQNDQTVVGESSAATLSQLPVLFSPKSNSNVLVDQENEEEPLLLSSGKNTTNEEDEENNAGKLVHAEQAKKGMVSWWVLRRFLKGMGFWTLCLCLGSGMCAYGVMAWNDVWLAMYVQNSALPEPTITATMFVTVYSIGMIVFLSMLQLTSFAFSYGGVRSSSSLHHEALETIMHAKLSWFESIPSGRTISRFSADLSVVDQTLARFFDNWWQFTCTLTALISVVTVLVPWVLIAVVIVFFALVYVNVLVDRANRVVKREANMRMSPIQTLLNEGIFGRSTIRALEVEEVITNKFGEALDAWISMSFWSISLQNCGMLLSCAVSFTISLATGIAIVLIRDKIDPSIAGLAITYSFVLPYFMMHYAFVSQICQSSLASLERLLDYAGLNQFGVCTIPQEPKWHLDTDPKLTTLEPIKLTSFLSSSAPSASFSTSSSSFKKQISGLGSSLRGLGESFRQQRQKRLNFQGSFAYFAKKAREEQSLLNPGTSATTTTTTTTIKKTVDELELGTTTSQETWPKSGLLEFKNVSLRYRIGLPLAVKNVTFTVPHGSHVGIVGRTGSGKSSLLLLAFRILDCTEGSILFDGRDISSLGLLTLRRAFGIVPQQSILFQGSVRKNLDPFGEFNDDSLERALRATFPSKHVTLDTEVDSFTLSAGQRQLLAITRVLLRPVYIIIADEASSSLDEKTDHLLQDLLRKHFKSTTTITIAHRLNSVINSDKILVMDDGYLVENDTPLNLLQRENGHLQHIAKALGEEGFNQLLLESAQQQQRV